MAARRREAGRRGTRPDWKLKAVKIWRKTIYRRDAWCCQYPGCGLGTRTFPFRRIEAHHIWPYRLYPKKFYDLNNGITLCVTHHKHVTDREEEFAELFEKALLEKGNRWTPQRQTAEKKKTSRALTHAARIAALRRRKRKARTARRSSNASSSRRKGK